MNRRSASGCATQGRGERVVVARPDAVPDLRARLISHVARRSKTPVMAKFTWVACRAERVRRRAVRTRRPRSNPRTAPAAGGRWEALDPTGRLARGVAFGASLEVRELARLHDPVRGLQQDGAEHGPEPRRVQGPVPADHESGAVAGQFVEQEAPEGVGVIARRRTARVKRAPLEIE